MNESNVKGEAKNILIVTQGDIEAMRHFPLELRSMFDPKAASEYNERCREAKKENEQRHRRWKERYGDELPF